MLKKTLFGFAILLALLAALGCYMWFFEQTTHSIPEGQPRQILASDDAIINSIRKGVEYLKLYQEKDGEFSKGMLDPKPAVTALIVDALVRSPEHYSDIQHPFIQKAVQTILLHQQRDGSICTPSIGLETYCTAVSLMALTALENPAYATNIEKAKNYLISVQYKDDEGDLNAGGAGYNKGGRVSGDVTANWVEALKSAGVKEGDPAFKNAEKFFARLQNNSETNLQPATGTEVGKDGGFFYRPGESKAKPEIGKTGKRIPKSYGLMSYAGLKSFLYMSMKKDDPRVVSAFKWVQDNYTLEENRNIGADGLYYYFLTMAKALAAYGEPNITTADGKIHPWAKELSERLIRLQKPDGSWQNDHSSRWKEDDSVLVSGFAIRTLSICHEAISTMNKGLK